MCSNVHTRHSEYSDLKITTSDQQQKGRCTKLRTDILEFLEKEIYIRCSKPANIFGIRLYKHFCDVVSIGKALSEKYGADPEIVMIAGWLHDIASATDKSMIENHQIFGAKIAEDILKQLDYDADKTAHVVACIKNHGGSKPREKRTIEEMCVADADAAAHFYDVPSLLYMAFNVNNLDENKGAEFVKNKLTRSYNKLSDKSKEMFKNIYDCDIAALSGLPQQEEGVNS